MIISLPEYYKISQWREFLQDIRTFNVNISVVTHTHINGKFI